MIPQNNTSHLAKGQQSKVAIIEAALALATEVGLEGLSIGTIAEMIGRSKSGVFAHFGSREELQISVIREYHRRFEAVVFFPAIKKKRGLPRLCALFENWVERIVSEIGTDCLYISGAVEFDDKPGSVRDALLDMVNVWFSALERAIKQSIQENHLKEDTDIGQLLFEIHGLILALHYEARFLRNNNVKQRMPIGFYHLLQRYTTPSAPPLVFANQIVTP